MPVEIVRLWKERTGISIAEGYGLTEAMPVSYNHYYMHVVGSIGQPLHGVEVQIRDKSGKQLEQGQEGEICVRGPIVMKGYLNDPEGNRLAFWDGGWYRSGDVGLFDTNGYLYIIDRLKDMIITGGENVYSREVEEVLYKSQEVQGRAVIGLPDKEWGERVTAVIVPKPGKQNVPGRHFTCEFRRAAQDGVPNMSRGVRPEAWTWILRRPSASESQGRK